MLVLLTLFALSFPRRRGPYSAVVRFGVTGRFYGSRPSRV